MPEKIPAEVVADAQREERLGRDRVWCGGFSASGVLNLYSSRGRNMYLFDSRRWFDSEYSLSHFCSSFQSLLPTFVVHDIFFALLFPRI